MAVEIKVPELGEDIDSGEVVNVPVAVGDSVSDGQTILEVEAGKATIEIPASGSGTVSALHVEQGDTVEPGQVVLELEIGDQKTEDGGRKTEDGGQKTEDGGHKTEGGGQKTEAGGQKTEDGGQKTEDGGQKTEDGGQKTEGGGQKTEDGGQKTEDGDQRSEDGLSTEASAKAEGQKAKGQKTENEDRKSAATKAIAVSAAPGVRRLARELGVDIHLVPPTGPAGYITAEDVKEFAKNGLSTGAPAGPQTTRVEKMSAIRKATMNHMAHCWAVIPHVTHHDTADITELEALRKRYAPKAESVGAKLTMTAMLIKIIASALKKHPKFNCSIDPEKGEIIYKEFYNIGIAMDTPKGLLVPVIRDGDRKNMVELALELKTLAEKAREGKIDAADLKGGTFTFTNIGIIGGSFFTPIVNSPEVAILGSGRANWEACPDGGEKKFKLPLSLSYDHRIIDGADGARFLKWIIDAIEEPLLLSLEG